MGRIEWDKIPYPGLRNIKTAISVAACMLLYQSIGREGVMLAAVAAVICMQDSVEKSVKDGMYRLIGTLMGGIYGTLFTYFNIINKQAYIFILASFLGIIVFIYICNIANIKGSIIIGCVVFLIIITEKEAYNAPLLYSFNRVLDTMIGITIALAVNSLLFRPKPERFEGKNQGGNLAYMEHTFDIHYELRRAGKHKISNWAGGTTTELYIYPKASLYADRDFDWRISSALVNLEQSSFTKLNGYMRHIMIISGKMKLSHEGQHTVLLEQYDQDFFNGGWNTKSVGKCTDFNLMLKKGKSGSLKTVKADELKKFDINAVTAYYCLSDQITLEVLQNHENILSEDLNTGDFIVFHDFLAGAEKQYGARFYYKNLDQQDSFSNNDGVIAVEAKIFNINPSFGIDQNEEPDL